VTPDPNRPPPLPAPPLHGAVSLTAPQQLQCGAVSMAPCVHRGPSIMLLMEQL
jgi:hypothetical protein